MLKIENMQKKQVFVILTIFTIMVIMIALLANELYRTNLKMDILKEELATKNLHYEWLQEVTNSLLHGYDFDEDLRGIAEFIKMQPKV